MKNNFFTSIAITSQTVSTKLQISTRIELFSLKLFFPQNQQIDYSHMEENKTLSLVLPENLHFLRGDIKGFQVPIIQFKK